MGTTCVWVRTAAHTHGTLVAGRLGVTCTIAIATPAGVRQSRAELWMPTPLHSGDGKALVLTHVAQIPTAPTLKNYRCLTNR